MVDAFDPVSSVVLKEDVIKKFREFFPTLAEYKGQTEKQIIISSRFANNSTRTHTMYTVPDNFTLWITSAYMTVSDETTISSNQARVHMQISSDEQEFLSLYYFENESDTQHLSQTYPMPLKLEAGESVQVEFNASGSSLASDVIAGFTGWLEPKKVI